MYLCRSSSPGLQRIQNSCSEALRVVQRLLLAYPDAAIEPDSTGRLPVQVVHESLKAQMNTSDPLEQVGAAALELIAVLGLPVSCDGQADNFFYLLETTEWRRGCRRGSNLSMRNLEASQTDLFRHPSETQKSRIVCLCVEEILYRGARKCGLPAGKLADATDTKGRQALNIATEANRKTLENRILFLQQYQATRALILVAACLCTHRYICLHAYAHAYAHAYTHVHTHALHTCLHACLCTCL